MEKTAAIIPIKKERDRSTFIGGSDLPAILGLSRWKSPSTLWEEKKGLAPAQKPLEHLDWGHRLEPIILDVAQEKIGAPILSRNAIFQHPELPHFCTEVDGLIQGVTPIDAKTSASRGSWGDEWTDDVPYEYLIQVTWQIGIMRETGSRADHGKIAALICGSSLKIFNIAFDEILFSHLLDAAQLFWASLQREKKPDALLTPLKFEPMSSVEATDNILDIVHKLQTYKSLKADAEILMEELKNFMGEKERLTKDGEVLATYKPQSSSRPDLEAIYKQYPESKEMKKSSTFKVLRIKSGEKNGN